MTTSPGQAPRRPGRQAAFLALILAGLCWGLGFPLGKLALRETNPAHMVLLRFAVATLAALPFALGREARALFGSPTVLLAGLLYGLGFLLQFAGLARVSVTLAALLVGAMPALIAGPRGCSASGPARRAGPASPPRRRARR